MEDNKEPNVRPIVSNGRRGVTWHGMNVLGVRLTNDNLRSDEFIKLAVDLLNYKIDRILLEAKQKERHEAKENFTPVAHKCPECGTRFVPPGQK